MTRLCKSASLGIVLIMLLSCRSSASDAHSSETTLNSEQLHVYADFIQSFSKTNFKFLSNETFPLDLSSLAKDAACLRGFQLDETKELSKRGHSLGPDVLRGASIHLIGQREELAILKQRDAEVVAHGVNSMMNASGMIKDPGVLALSEIAFDKSHHLAVLKYVFLCGSHCNSGVVLVLEEVGSRWTAATRRPCSVAINGENPLP